MLCKDQLVYRVWAVGGVLRMTSGQVVKAGPQWATIAKLTGEREAVRQDSRHQGWATSRHLALAVYQDHMLAERRRIVSQLDTLDQNYFSARILADQILAHTRTCENCVSVGGKITRTCEDIDSRLGAGKEGSDVTI